jgi:hypothetical protein
VVLFLVDHDHLRPFDEQILVGQVFLDTHSDHALERSVAGGLSIALEVHLAEQ